MKTVGALPKAIEYRKKDLLIGKSKVLTVLAANPTNPSFRAIIRTSRLWNQLCRVRPTNPLVMICLVCGDKLKRNHGANHYNSTLISSLSLLKFEHHILNVVDWYGFGDETAKDFQVLCDMLRRQLDPRPPHS